MNRMILVMVVTVLSGCVGEEPKSVQWFKDHEAERKAVIDDCNRNAVPESVECLNAQEAQDDLSLARRGYVKPKPVNFD
ncbi:MAG: EexN family lipoprotein [Lysobacter sp.]